MARTPRATGTRASPRGAATAATTGGTGTTGAASTAGATATTATATAVGGGTATATVAATAPPAFSLRPSIQGQLDFEKKGDRRVFERGAASVYDEYPMDAHHKEGFLLALSLRAQEQNWSTVAKTGVLDVEVGGTRYNLCEHYGSLTATQIKAYVASWFSSEGRESQDDQMIVECLRASLSKEALLKAYQHREKFTVQDNSLGSPRECGVLMLKVTLDESSLTSNATVMKLKKELNELPELIGTLKYDVPKFNDAVLSVQQQLTQYGSSAPELFHQVLPAYLAIPEPKFKVYMEGKKSAHEDGSLTLSVQSLMELARARYCTQRDQNDWSPEGVGKSGTPEFLALEARVKKAHGEVKRLRQQLTSAKKGKGKGKSPAKKGNPSKRSRKSNSDWKYVKPHPGDKLANGQFEQERDGKTFYWCSQKTGAPASRGCNMWTVHKPADCKGLSTSKKPGGYKKKAVKKLEAKAAALTLSDSESSGYE